MPCIYHDDRNPRVIYESKIYDALEAMLCHAFTVAEEKILNAPLEVYVECGTKRVDMQAWWDNHRAEDAKRREREAQEKACKRAEQELAEERQRVLDAMTPEVRRMFES